MTTKADLESSLSIAREKGWELYANDLSDQINGMQQALDELGRRGEEGAKGTVNG
jgi:hypothetical protein